MAEAPKILIIDDDIDICQLLRNFLEKKGYKVKYALNGQKGLDICRHEEVAVVLCDYRLGDMDGIECLAKIKEINNNIVVIMITAYADIKMAISSIKSGAFDYLPKPLVPDEVTEIISNAFCRKEIDDISSSSPKDNATEDLISGKSLMFRDLERQIDLVAPTNYNIILEGSSGTGKEVTAREIHYKSKRRKNPFVAIDCGVLSRELAGSELFGHIKGSFTGAIADKTGHFEWANGGTLFLDEVTNLPYEVQAFLLRVLQEKKFKKIGSLQEIELDVRVIAATNEDIRDAYQRGRFREDLFHRLNEFSIKLPDLRERKEDIPLFANFFLSRVNLELNRNILGFQPDVLEFFMEYSWPGNIRELQNMIRRAAVLEKSDYITDKFIPVEELSALTTFDGGEQEIGSPALSSGNLKETANIAEYQAIQDVLKKVRYNKSKAAEILNIDRKTLYNKLRYYNSKYGDSEN